MTDDPPVIYPLPPIHRSPVCDVPDDVVRYLARLPKGQSTRRVAEALIDRSPIPIDCIGPMAQSLSDPTRNGWKENVVAVWAAARSAGSADRYAAAGWLSHVLEFWPSLDSWPRLKRSYIRTMIFLYVVLALKSLTGAAIMPWTYFIPPFVAVPLFLFAYPLSAWLDRGRLNRIRAEAAKGLGLLGIPHSAGPLAVGALDNYEDVRTASRDSLLKVLPTLSEEQYGRLPMDTTPRLCGLLNGGDEALLFLTLRAIRAVGDSRALQPVERFVRRSPGPWMNVNIAMEADQTLAVLYARKKRENEAASLLRPTNNPLEPPPVLLRPYVHTGDQPAENLLRATTDD